MRGVTNGNGHQPCEINRERPSRERPERLTAAGSKARQRPSRNEVQIIPEGNRAESPVQILRSTLIPPIHAEDGLVPDLPVPCLEWQSRGRPAVPVICGFGPGEEIGSSGGSDSVPTMDETAVVPSHEELDAAQNMSETARPCAPQKRLIL